MFGFPFVTSLIVAMISISLLSLIVNRGMNTSNKNNAIRAMPTKHAKKRNSYA